MSEKLNNYELKLAFSSSPKDAEAFNKAIIQVLSAWERHERLRNILVDLVYNPAEKE